ncbi:prephenate dehydrogenase [Halorubellus sp. JP-L1]|uniref:prephenate dehydrogenase/arogenate dehydrogenase family protein n=1 Tax=Halorubellus sp. JP-L1 TaxID=2715753 RepID=UPI00140B9CA7|nr:prephenate dehydrogenase/arogenate dehydrogenase family protein [Halorubellus sp. JP-L1]NHN40084.1 prephenate dehydrogenase [Halorubellus sp. JP-L1]
MRVLVVGAGRMGRWLGAAVDATVAFADADPDAAERAAAAVPDAERAPLDPGDDETTYDVVCVAVPLPAVDDAIATHAPRAERAVVDVGGEMAAPVAAMAEHAPGRERLSLHPLFAPENAPGSIAAVHDERGPVTDALRESLTAAGNDVFDTTVAEHDDAMASVQAATHAAILAWRLATEDVRDEFHTPLSRELADLAEHVTGQDSRVYADIADRYPDGRDALADAAARIADADRDAFLEAFADARARAERGTESPTEPPTDREHDQ